MDLWDAMHAGKGYVALALLVGVLAVLATGGDSRSEGIQGANLPPEGCTCHGPAGDNGIPDSNVTIFFRLDPSVSGYQLGQTYHVSLGPSATDVAPSNISTANKGGFNLQVNIGSLAAAPGFEDFIQGTSLERTHTKAGDVNGRVYNLTWTAPVEDGGAAVFKVYVNTVNGDGANDERDHWNRAIVVLPGPDGTLSLGAEPIDPTTIGVNWYAHYVGLISFVAVVATLVVYYFVLKFGESIHTTDHRDRAKEK